MAKLVRVPAGLVDKVESDVRHWLRGIVESMDGRYTYAGLLDHIRDGTVILWIIGMAGPHGVKPCGIMGTDIAKTPAGTLTGRVLFLTGADRAKWVHLISDYEDAMRAAGCTRIEITARKGWARELRDYTMTHVLLERAI